MCGGGGDMGREEMQYKQLMAHHADTTHHNISYSYQPPCEAHTASRLLPPPLHCLPPGCPYRTVGMIALREREREREKREKRVHSENNRYF